MKLKLPRIKIPASQTLKVIFSTIFVAAAIVILFPQLDYQEWYPQGLGIHDYKLGVEFSPHKAVTVTAQNTADLISAVLARSKAMDNDDIFIDASGEGSITVHLPSTIEDATIQNLFSNGDIEIYRPTDPEAMKTDLSLMFDLSSYQPTDIDISKIYEAEVTSAQDPYAYISLHADSAEIDKINNIANQAENSNIAVVIDGNLNLGWLLAGQQGASKFPTLVVMTDMSSAKIIASELTSTPLTESQLAVNISSMGPIYPVSTQYYLIGIIAFVILSGILYRIFYRKERLNLIAATSLLVLGIISATKLASFTLTVPALLILVVVITMYLALNTDRYLPISVILLAAGIGIGQIGGATMHGIATIMTIAGGFGAVYYCILFLAGHYEEQ